MSSQVPLSGQPRAGRQVPGPDTGRDVVGYLDVDELRRVRVDAEGFAHTITGLQGQAADLTGEPSRGPVADYNLSGAPVR